MSIIDFDRSQLQTENEYNYEIPDSRDTTQLKADGYNDGGDNYPF